MRVAFLLHGIIGGMEWKGGIGKLIDYRFCRDKFYENIIKPNNADVFIHSWSKEQENDLMKIYNPKKAIIEEQRTFYSDKRNIVDSRFRIKSRFYSTQVVTNLKKQYEKKHKFVYDFVMITRFDLIWHTLINFKELDPSYFYIGKWNTVDYNKRQVSSVYQPGPNAYLNDLFFFSNSKFMDDYGNTFDIIDTMKPNPHKVLRTRLNRHKEISHRKKFIYLKYFDHDVYRDRVESYENGVTTLKKDFKNVPDLKLKHKRAK